MEKKLKQLISHYQAEVRIAIELMISSDIPMPSSAEHWIEIDIPPMGELVDGSRYVKHGYGCKVFLSSGTVDFDFGSMGEIDGFDAWRLFSFAGPKLREYGFESLVDVEGSLVLALRSRSLILSEYDLYYIATEVRTLAVEVSRDRPGDLLPHRDQDKVLSVYGRSFLAADLMRKNYEKLGSKHRRNGYLSRNDEVDYRIYFSSWLGYLGVTCEGFRKLDVRMLLTIRRPGIFRELIPLNDELASMLKIHADDLRKFRNNVFHLQEDIKSVLRFAVDDGGRLVWANELHAMLASFFSEYRVLCEVHYFRQERRNESQMTSPRRRRKSASASVDAAHA